MTTRTQSKASQLNKSHAVRKSSRTHADTKEIFSFTEFTNYKAGTDVSEFRLP